MTQRNFSRGRSTSFAIRLLAFGVILVFCPTAASAQRVLARVETDSVSIGERTTLVLSILHDAGRRAVFPDETGQAPPEAIGAAGDFELLRRRSSGFRTLADGSRLDSVVYEATTFAVDTSRVNPTVFLATETDTVAVSGPPIYVPVRSIVPQDTQDVRDITQIADFPRSWWPWLLLLLVAAIVGWLWRRHRNRIPQVEPEPEPEPEPETPIEEAIRRLEVLSNGLPDDPESSAPFFDELADILRTYLSRHTGEHALEMTSSELVDALRRRRTPATDRIAEIEQLLRAADLVKFADYRPPVDRARAAHAATRVTIERIEAESVRPVPTPPPPTT